MTSSRLLLATVLASLAFFPSCKKEDKASAQTMGTEMNKTLGEMKEFSADKAAEFAKTFDKSMATLGEKMDKLKMDVSAKGEAAKTAMSATLAELDKKRKELSMKLAELPSKTGDAWTALQKEITSGYQELEKAVTKATKDLK
jgi:hypothetical protein